MDINFKCIRSSSSKSSEKISQICWEHNVLVRDYASVVLEADQGYYNHPLPSMSNVFLKILDTRVLVLCECVNFNGGGAFLSLGQGAHRDLLLIGPFLFWVDNNYFCQKTRSERNGGDDYIGHYQPFSSYSSYKAGNRLGANKTICFQPPLALSSPFGWEPGRTMSISWTPCRSPLHPCQSLKHLTSNHCSDSGAAGYHVSFAFNLATAVSSSASGPLPAVHLSYLGLTTGGFCFFFFEVCVSPTIIKAKCLSFYSLPPLTMAIIQYLICPFLFLLGCCWC